MALSLHMEESREETHFKIIFSEPTELEMFKRWCLKNKGEYAYDNQAHFQKGKLPKLKVMKADSDWWDMMSYYLLHIAGYEFHSTTHPSYSGEIYVKRRLRKTGKPSVYWNE